MKIRDHLLKAEAFERSASKLDPTTDTALYVVFLLRAGTNRINAALHALKTTTDGAATPEKLGDLNHTYKPRLKVPVPNELKMAFQHLAMIEDLRTDYVRGSKRFDAATLAVCNAAFHGICADTGPILAREAP
jgi:hypothetical protein